MQTNLARRRHALFLVLIPGDVNGGGLPEDRSVTDSVQNEIDGLKGHCRIGAFDVEFTYAVAGGLFNGSDYVGQFLIQEVQISQDRFARNP